MPWCLGQRACTVSWRSLYFWNTDTISVFQIICNDGNAADNGVWYSLRFGEDMRIPCTAEELKKIIGCYFWMGLVKMPNQQSFREEDLSCNRVLTVLSINWLETLIVWMRKQRKTINYRKLDLCSKICGRTSCRCLLEILIL